MARVIGHRLMEVPAARKHNNWDSTDTRNGFEFLADALCSPVSYNHWESLMNTLWNSILWGQFDAAIGALRNAIISHPDEHWDDRSRQPEFWYMAYHALFWLDLYLSESPDGFAPPEPFTLGELDPEGVLPESVLSKETLLGYLEHCRAKCRRTIAEMTEEKAARRFLFGNVNLPIGELHLYNMRHVQHHAAQLNMLLRQRYDIGSRWVFTSAEPMGEIANEE